MTGWIMLIITLLSNLISHFLSIKFSQKTIDEINNKEYDKVFENVGTRNKYLNYLNITSITTLILGITLIITFVTKNINHMSNNDKNRPNTQRPVTPKPLTEEKGRPINNPPQNKSKR